MNVADKQKRVIAKIEALRKRAAAGDMKAKAEMDRVTKIVSRVVAAQRAQNAAAEAAAVQQAALLAQAMADTEVVGDDDVLGGEDRLDIADRVAASAYHMDSLSQKVVQRGEEWQQLNQQAPFLRTNPVSVLNGILGNQIVLASGEQGDVANWEGDDAETGPVTVVLGPSNGEITYDPAGGGGAALITPMRAYAEIRFGTKGFSTLLRVDVGTGCQLSLNASAVRVTLVMPSAIDGLQNQRQPLTGMLSFRAPLRTAPLTYTVYHDDEIGTLSNFAFGIVPPFAKTLLIKTPNWVDAWQLTLFDTAGNVIETVQKATLTTFLTPITLSGDCASYSLAAVGANVPSARLVFGLVAG